MGNYILVDTENIGTYNALKKIVKEELKQKEFNIVLFQSKNSKPIKPEFWDVVLNKPKSTTMLEVVGNGNQNMDIQMAAYVGYLIASSEYNNSSCCDNKSITIYVYSNDSHLENCSKFLGKFNKNFNVKYLKEDLVNSNEVNRREELITEVNKFTNSTDVVLDIIEKSKGLSEVHNGLVKKFSNGKELYKGIKKYLNYKK